MTRRIVIVGAGVAGATAAKTLRREGYSGEIVLLGAEDGLPYRRPMVSKDMLAGTAVEQRTLLESAESWRALDIDLHTATTIEAIDPDRSHIRLSDRGEIGYDSLLLTTGARPRQLSNPSSNVHTLRGRADVAPLRAALFDTGSLLIVGAGLIGCEVAATARALGIAVTMVHAGHTPLERVAPSAIGEFYRKLHADNGVELHSDVLLRRLEDTGDSVVVEAADGRTWSNPTALVAIGSTPNTDLAEAAGLIVDNGIVVDEHFRTSAPEIFAAGDAATRYDPISNTHRREEHWNSALWHGAAAAKSMLGQPIPPAEVPWGWSIQYGLNLQFAGRIDPADELVVHGELGTPDVTVYAMRDQHLIGAVAVGRPADIRAARTRIAATP